MSLKLYFSHLSDRVGMLMGYQLKDQMLYDALNTSPAGLSPILY